MIHSQIERELQRQKEKDQHWDDQIDVSLSVLNISGHCLMYVFQDLYQRLPVPYHSRLFKYIPPSETRSSLFSSDTNEPRTVQPQSVRLRFGRGGRVLLDRRNPNLRSSPSGSRMTSDWWPKSHLDKDEGPEHKRRLTERWRYDMDDYPSNGPEGLDEQDRVLIDDYDPK